MTGSVSMTYIPTQDRLQQTDRISNFRSPISKLAAGNRQQTRAMAQTYHCPGEKHSISRSVHLARIAAFYPKCRECAHRHDAGPLPEQTLERLQSAERRVARRSLFTDEGIRGVYLNELTRREAMTYAAALGSLLWSKAPLIGRNPTDASSARRPRRMGPTVVVGHDERPASPDIVIGVVAALRRMGCSIIDVGLTTRPCFCFAVDHLQAVAGVYVTGAGRDARWTGLDIVGVGAQPWSEGGKLDELASRCQKDVFRPTRSAGPYRSYQAHVAYEAVLGKHFHGIRPLTVRCVSASRQVRNTLSRMFQKIPCELDLSPFPDGLCRCRELARISHVGRTEAAESSAGTAQQAKQVPTPCSSVNRNLATEVPAASPVVRSGLQIGEKSWPDDNVVSRFGKSVRDASAHLGVLINEDGMGCTFLDERGCSVRSEQVLGLLTECFVLETSEAKVVVMTDSLDRLGPLVEAAGGHCLDGGRSTETLWQTLHESRAHVGLDQAGRFWFREAAPTSDALLAIARILQMLSRLERPLSAIVQGDTLSDVSREEPLAA